MTTARMRQRVDSPATDRQILYGQPVFQLGEDQDLYRDGRSGYVGYVSPHDLARWTQPTHRVTARATFLFQEPDFKAPDPLLLSIGSELKIESIDGKYARTQDGRFAIAAHLSGLEDAQTDLAQTAEKLLGTPYLWGGNSAFGIDCSGLVQMTCQAANLPCPGDSGQQVEELGTALASGTPPKRNDLMFWKGHVALVTSPTMLIHANAHHMCVAFEEISEALARIEAQGGGPLVAHKRL